MKQPEQLHPDRFLPRDPDARQMNLMLAIDEYNATASDEDRIKYYWSDALRKVIIGDLELEKHFTSCLDNILITLIPK